MMNVTWFAMMTTLAICKSAEVESVSISLWIDPTMDVQLRSWITSEPTVGIPLVSVPYETSYDQRKLTLFGYYVFR